MESLINDFIKRELLSKTEVQLKNDTPLFESKILDSRSLIKLVLFVEHQFGVVVPPEELFPENFETIDRLSAYLRSKKAA